MRRGYHGATPLKRERGPEKPRRLRPRQLHVRVGRRARTPDYKPEWLDIIPTAGSRPLSAASPHQPPAREVDLHNPRVVQPTLDEPLLPAVSLGTIAIGFSGNQGTMFTSRPRPRARCWCSSPGNHEKNVKKAAPREAGAACLRAPRPHHEQRRARRAASTSSQPRSLGFSAQAFSSSLHRNSMNLTTVSMSASVAG